MSLAIDQVFEDLFSAFDPVFVEILGILPSPINLAVGFIYGGIKELLIEVLFG